MSAMERRRNQLLTDVAGYVATIVKDHGLKADVAEQIGAAVADELATQWGGSIITIPKDHYFRLALRDLQILSEHQAGRAIPAIAERFNMTESAVRKMIWRAGVRGQDPRQRSMFEEAQP